MSARVEISSICLARSGSSGMYGCACCASRYASSNLSRLGEPDDLRQRLLPRPADLRVALRPPCDATGDDGERDDRGRDPRAARRPRPRDRRLLSGRRQSRVACRCKIAHVDAVIVRRSRSRTSVRLTTSSNSGATSGRSVRIGAIGAVNTAWMIASVFVPWNGTPTGQHLVRDDAQRPEIRPCVHDVSSGLFGRHVAGRADCAAGSRELRRRLAHLNLREAEVQNFHLSRRRQHQVRWLQIPVNDAGGVCGVERIGHLRDHAGDLGHRQRAAGEASRERFALVVRHRDERLAGVVADLVDRGDVGMIECAGGARLPQQAGRGFRMLAVSGDRNLSATRRLRFVSSARYTVPIPPAPMWLMIR